jgi:hypothetical protein
MFIDSFNHHTSIESFNHSCFVFICKFKNSQKTHARINIILSNSIKSNIANEKWFPVQTNDESSKRIVEIRAPERQPPRTISEIEVHA